MTCVGAGAVISDDRDDHERQREQREQRRAAAGCAPLPRSRGRGGLRPARAAAARAGPERGWRGVTALVPPCGRLARRRAPSGAEHARRLRRRAPRAPPGRVAGAMPVGAVAQRPSHLARGLVALARVERERDRDRVGELGADGRDERVEQSAASSCCCLSASSVSERRLVGQAPGDQLVGDDAERVEVGAAGPPPRRAPARARGRRRCRAPSRPA